MGRTFATLLTLFLSLGVATASLAQVTPSDSTAVMREVGRRVGFGWGRVEAPSGMVVRCAPPEPCEPHERSRTLEAFRRGVEEGRGANGDLRFMGRGMAAIPTAPRFSADGKYAWVRVRIVDPWTRTDGLDLDFVLERKNEEWIVVRAPEDPVRLRPLRPSGTTG